MPGENGRKQKLPQNGTLREGMPQQNQQYKKTRNQLPRGNVQRRGEPEEIQQITQINRVLPDKNDNYGIRLKISGK